MTDNRRQKASFALYRAILAVHEAMWHLGATPEAEALLAPLQALQRAKEELARDR